MLNVLAGAATLGSSVIIDAFRIDLAFAGNHCVRAQPIRSTAMPHVVAAPMKCEGCGAGLGEQVARCPYCGLRLLDLDSFEVEASTLLRTLDERLEKGISSRTDRSLFSAFFAWLLSGPLAFILLGQLTDVGVVGRGAASLLMMAPGFLLFGWFTISRQARAEEALWQESVAAELRGFVERKSLSSSELLVLAKRLLGEESRLAKRIARGDLGA